MNDNRTKLKVLFTENGLRQWEVAEALGWAESKLSTVMRHPSDEEYETVKNAIEELGKDK